MPYQYDRVAADERTRHAMEEAAWQAENAAEAAAERVPQDLATEDGSELLDWIANAEDPVMDARMALLIEAVAQLGATISGTGAYSLAVPHVTNMARGLARAMIEAKTRELDK